MAVIQAEHLAREYVMGKNVIRAVDDISFTIQEGTYTMILGASGAGKSTVLNLLGGMDSPTSGSLRINGGISPGSTSASWRSTGATASASCSSFTT